MKRSKLTALLAAVMLTGMGPYCANAVLTLPIADDARTEEGTMRLGAGATLESDVNLYGGRFTYGIADGIALFGGGGLVDPDGISSEPFLQIGGQFSLPIDDLPFDLAVRAAFGIASFDESETIRERDFTVRSKTELDIWDLNVGLLASSELDAVTLYGFVGISYQKVDFKVTNRMNGFRESFSDDDTDTELAIGGGLLFPVDDSISLYGELMHIDELFVSLGGRFEF